MIGQILTNNNERCYSNFSPTFREVNTPIHKLCIRDRAIRLIMHQVGTLVPLIMAVCPADRACCYYFCPNSQAFWPCLVRSSRGLVRKRKGYFCGQCAGSEGSCIGIGPLIKCPCTVFVVQSTTKQCLWGCLRL
jgi:hypothetical protein